MNTSTFTDEERNRLARRIKDMLLLSNDRVQVRIEEYGRYPILISLKEAPDVPPDFYPRLTYSFNVGDYAYASTIILLFVDLKGWDDFCDEVKSFIISSHHSVPLEYGHFGLVSNENDNPNGYYGYGCEIPLDYSAEGVIEKLIIEIESVFSALRKVLPDWSGYYRRIKEFSEEEWKKTKRLKTDESKTVEGRVDDRINRQ